MNIMGYRAVCVEGEPKAGLTCIHCKDLLRSPVQTEEGHRLCKTCFYAIKILPGRVCMECAVTLTSDQFLPGTVFLELAIACQQLPFNVSSTLSLLPLCAQASRYYPDRAVEREVLALLVCCQYKSLGCLWEGQLQNWEVHIELCTYKGTTCPHSGCGQLVAQSDLEEHARGCPHRLVKCDYCHLQVPLNKKQDHESECEEMPVSCSWPGCSAAFPRRELLEHQEDGCVVVRCLTCGVKVERTTGLELSAGAPGAAFRDGSFNSPLQLSTSSESLSLPTISSSVQHLTSPCGPTHLAAEGGHIHMDTGLQTFNHHQQLARQVRGVEGVVSDVQGKQESVKKELVAVMEFMETMKAENTGLRTELDSVKEDLCNTRQALSSITRQLACEDGRSNTELQVQRLVAGDHETREALQGLRKKVEEVKREMMHPVKSSRGQDLYRRTGVVDSLYSQGSHDSSTLQQLQVTEELQRQLASMKVQLTELELQLQASLASTYNGSFIWRIPDVTRRRRDAIDGRVTSIYSPPFYTGRNGYKMCIRGYLNGDGMGYQSHLSLFFVIMRGECDPLLKWPFEYKVSMILVDQTHRKHIVQTFKPTPESQSFQQPKTEMNTASGCPQFAKLNIFDDPCYVKDDAMFIKCIVDTTKIFHP